MTRKEILDFGKKTVNRILFGNDEEFSAPGRVMRDKDGKLYFALVPDTDTSRVLPSLEPESIEDCIITVKLHR